MLPVVAALMRGNSMRLAPLVVIAAAAVAALASGYVMTTWIYPVELTSPAAVMIADLVAGAVIGALFWLALRRMDRARSRNQ